MFNIDLNKIIRWLMPHYLVKPKHIAWLTVLLSPVVWLYAQFLTYRDAKLLEATINSQVNRFNLALQQTFGNNGIFILHPSAFLTQNYIYLELEGATPEFDYLAIDAHTPVDYDFLQLEYDSEIDFIVRVPTALASMQDVIAAFVNKYKFYDKRFRIELY
jgi:hypothetical protein